MLTNKMHFLNQCFNSFLLVFYMFRTSHVHHQEDYFLHAVLYGMYSTRLCKQSTFNLLDCLHKRVEYTPHKAACTT